MSRAEAPAITSTPFTLRQWSLEHEVKPTFAKAFAERPTVQSILLCVAQYWADEADDAVHGHLVFSSRTTPRWPHQCEDQYSGSAGDGDLCSSCAWDSTPEGLTTWVQWDDNGFAIRAWQALCTEGASQEDDPNTVYAPAVLARRSGDAFTMETVGPVVRPWLELPTAALPAWFHEDGEAPRPIVNVATRDAAEQPFRDAIARAPLDDGPRHVFADWLQQREDPLGEFISLSLMPARSAELEERRRVLLAANVEAWLGELIHVVAPGSADFSRGLLTGCTVHFDESTHALADSPLFATVETLRFGETSQVIFSKTMTALRQVAGLGVGSPPLPQTVTELVCEVGFARDHLPLQVTAVTAICREQSEAEALAMLEKSQVVARLQRLSLVRIEPQDGGPTRIEQSGRACELRVGGWTTANTPTGWWLDARGALRLEGLSQLSSATAAAHVMSVLPSPALTLEPGTLWAPSEHDVSSFAAIAKVPVTVRDATPVQEPPPLEPPKREPPRALPVRVDPVTRSVHLELVEVAEDVSAPIAGRPPVVPMLVLLVGVVGLIARACVAG